MSISPPRIQTIGPRKRSPKYLGAIAGIMLIAGVLSLPMINTLALETQQASAVVTQPANHFRFTRPFSKESLLEFDKNKDREIQVEITSGVHKGEMAVVRYSSIMQKIGLGSGPDKANDLTQGTRVDITYTQRRLTDVLRVEHITLAKAPQR